MPLSLHPAIDNGFNKGNPNFPGGKLRCHCQNNKVEVTLTSNVAHNHACGCSKCWKPPGAVFSVVAVVPVDNLSVTSHANKLAIIDESAVIQRYACKVCGVHMYGRIAVEHPFKGLDFVHTELSADKGWQEPQFAAFVSADKGWQEPQFAAFVSSIIEQGYSPDKMDDVRGKFKSLGLETYDCLSPPLMDLIATATAQKAGKLPAKL